MLTFSLFLEAMIRRDAIPMDQDDINYLNQFPKHFWIDAIKQRYNDLLLQAINGRATDPVTVKVRTSQPGIASGGIQNIQVNARMNKLLKKLTNLGYDLSDPHPETQTLSNMKLMNREQARMLIKRWLNYSQQQGSTDLVPGFARFTPTKLEVGIQSYDNPQDDEARNRWAQLQSVVPEEAWQSKESFIKSLSNPNHRYHINYYYWRERPDEVMKGMIKRIQDNLAHPEIMDARFRKKLMMKHANNLSQTGHASSRMLQRAANNNVDVTGYIKKGYAISQITDALQNAYQGSKHRGEFVFNIKGKPQQQDDLKSIHQAVETPGSAIANYGKRRIGALRQAHSQQVMQNPELQKTVTPYRLAPETQPQPVQRRRAAKNIEDVMGFKDWVLARGKQV